MALVPADQITRLRESARRFAGGFTAGQKAVTVAAVLAVVVGGVIFMSIASRPTYQTLFTNLKPSDAAAITSKLASDHVPYQLADGGSTVLVPANEVDQERLAMAQAGLPADSTAGLSSSLSSAGITSSSIQQQAAYLEGLQSELEQTIDSIHGVSSSTVTVAEPANQTFALNTSNPTGASVMVTLQPGQTLSPGEVDAIVHLVGSSVPGLDASNVTVADSNGDLLAGPGVTAGAGSSGQSSSYDGAEQQKIDALLVPVLGGGNADVQVNATFNPDTVNTNTQTIVNGKNGQPQSFCTQTNSTSQNYTGTGAPPGGAAGTVTTVAGTGTGNYTNTQTQQTCETGTQSTTTQQPPGALERQTVAVLLNARALPRGVSMAKLRSEISAAAGIDTARGDQLSVSAMPFSTTASAQAAASAKAAAAAAKKQSMLGVARTAVIVLVILAVLFLLWRSARRARSAPEATVLTPEALAALHLQQLALDQPTAQLSLDTIDEVTSPEASEVNSFVDSQPDDVAKMLRTWMDERRPVPPV